MDSDVDDLQIDVELDSLGAGAVEMLMEPESGANLDTTAIDQFDGLDIGAPQGIVSSIGDEGKDLSWGHRDAGGDFDRPHRVIRHMPTIGG